MSGLSAESCKGHTSSRDNAAGKMVKIDENSFFDPIFFQSNTFDSKVPNWYHSACFFLEHMPRKVSDISNYGSLRWEDKKEIKDIIEKGESPLDEESVKKAVASIESKANSVNYSIGYSKTSNCPCVTCEEKIKKNEVRKRFVIVLTTHYIY